ncbi:ABC transporter ATP-binding protein [Pararhizobium sp.]|uniref:ABC transporter ATP-binding protein n=1 Tax=Pararhizobium sp. TaxID=1977563 RepID=UPI0027292B6B|nr:ABC transporter ATP-binding protein [Pararhizobium sp.]MDO9417803.1 ABC transporter ATP-binding protein [Pararhizobium sp.]
MADVVLTDLGKRYGEHSVLKGLNLDISDGEFVVLVGPSGCGKSTTLQMIAGLETASSGSIVIGGRDVTRLPPKARDISMVFQSYALFPHMSVRDNIAFGPKIRREPKAQIEKSIKDVTQLLKIEDYLDRLPKALSGGQRQRVALARALVRRPGVFLMDEPLSNLDAKLRVEARSFLVKMHQDLGITTVYVTHDQSEAMTMGSRIVVMKDGVIQQAASPLEIYSRPANQFVASFIGSPAMNSLELDFAGGMLEDREAGLRIALPDQHRTLLEWQGLTRVILGVRPEDIRILGRTDPRPGVRFGIDVVQRLGHETLLDLAAGKHRIMARAAASEDALPNEVREFEIDMNKVHFFDIQTGANLQH